MTWNYRLSLLATLIAAHVVLFGAAAVSAAWAETPLRAQITAMPLLRHQGQARAEGKATKAVQHWARERATRAIQAP
jgi:hypothetical protein